MYSLAAVLLFWLIFVTVLQFRILYKFECMASKPKDPETQPPRDNDYDYEYERRQREMDRRMDMDVAEYHEYLKRKRSPWCKNNCLRSRSPEPQTLKAKRK